MTKPRYTPSPTSAPGTRGHGLELIEYFLNCQRTEVAPNVFQFVGHTRTYPVSSFKTSFDDKMHLTIVVQSNHVGPLPPVVIGHVDRDAVVAVISAFEIPLYFTRYYGATNE